MKVSLYMFKKVLIIFGIIVLLLFLTKYYDTAVFIIGLEILYIIYFLKNTNEDLFIYFIVCTISQNFILLTCSREIGSFNTDLIIISKELMIYIISMFYFVKNRVMKPEKKDCIFIAFAVYAVYSLIFKSNSLIYALTSLRQFMVPFFCYYFGKAIDLKKIQGLNRMMRFLSFAVLFVCVTGFAIYILCDDSFWLNLGYNNYCINKVGRVLSFDNFYTYDLGFRLKRFVSIFVDPLAAIHFLSAGFVLLMSIYPKKKYAVKSIAIFALVLGLSKSTVVLVLVIIFTKIYANSKNRFNRRIYEISVIVAACIVFGYLLNYTANLEYNTAIGNHFNSLIAGLNNFTLLGDGLGTSGYNVTVMGLDGNDIGVGESLFATIISQMGIFGLLLYLFMFYVLKDGLMAYRNTKNGWSYASVILLIAVMVESLVSTSSISMLGTGIYFVIAGIAGNAYELESEFQTCVTVETVEDGIIL